MNTTVQAFMTNYPKIAQHGWQIASVAQIQGASYQNANASGPPLFTAALTAGGNGGSGLHSPTPAPSITAGNNAVKPSDSGAVATSAPASASATGLGAASSDAAPARRFASAQLALTLASAVFFASQL
jgi:hypothetical protein